MKALLLERNKFTEAEVVLTNIIQSYVFTPVCQSFCSRGVSASVQAWIHTPLRRRPPWGQTPREQTPPRSRHPPAVHAGRYGQQAGGTHPTGMHTCFEGFFQVNKPVEEITMNVSFCFAQNKHFMISTVHVSGLSSNELLVLFYK